MYVNHSVGGDDAVWATPYVVPGATTALTSDDISSIVHFGSRIGVMWSDQNDGRFHFAVHEDGAPDQRVDRPRSSRSTAWPRMTTST